MIRSGGLLFISFLLAVRCLAGDKPSEVVMQQQKAVNSLKRVLEMKQPLERCFANVEDAKREMNEFQAKVVKGDIPIENNNGLWCAVLDESKTVTKLGNYAATNGPMIFFMKRVYHDASHKTYANELGYELNISTNGMLESYSRGDLKEMMAFHNNGRIKSFSHETTNGWYTAKWDENNTQLLNESSSVGILNDQKPDKGKP